MRRRRRRKRRSTKAKEHKAFFQNPKVRLSAHSSAKKRAGRKTEKILVDRNSNRRDNRPNLPRDSHGTTTQTKTKTESAREREREKRRRDGQRRERERERERERKRGE
jgi:ATP-dependent RNA helicase DDX46/PRP5